MFNRNRQEFYESAAALLHVGNAPLKEVVQSLAASEPNWFFGHALRRVSMDMADGSDFHSAILRHPIAFPRIEGELLKYTEYSQPFEDALLSLAKLNAVRRPLWKTVIAASAGVLITAGNLFFLMILVVPMFEDMFNDMLAGEPLPRLTRWYVDASHFFTESSTQLFLGLALAATAYLGFRFLSPDRFRNPFYNVLPFSHTTGLERDCQRACQRLSVMVQNGAQINQALATVCGATETRQVHKHMSAWLRHMKHDIPLEAAVNIEPARKGPVQLLQATLGTPFCRSVADELQELAGVYEERAQLRRTSMPISVFSLVIMINFFFLGTGVFSMLLPVVKLTECLC